MELICGKNEAIIKSWDYALEKKGLERKTFNLTATDKRLISTAESSKSCSRSEVYLSDIKSLDYKFKRNGSFLAILMLIFGILTSILVFGILYIVLAVRILRAKQFVLVVNTYGQESLGLAVGASAKLKREKHGRIRVIVNKNVAKEIINELGALILDAKAKASN